jgi:hypothetical protein
MVEYLRELKGHLRVRLKMDERCHVPLPQVQHLQLFVVNERWPRQSNLLFLLIKLEKRGIFSLELVHELELASLARKACLQWNLIID